MRTKPTREAVEETLSDFEAHELIGSRRDVYELVVSVFKGYLAQEEELKRKDRRINRLYLIKKDLEAQLIDNGLRVPPRGSVSKLAQLEAENQALKTSMEAGYIERQAKHIQELVKENGELKATRVEWQLNLGIVPPDKEGQPLHYTADDATGDEGNEGGQP